MKKLVVPKFATESKEARWWDAHMDIVEANLSDAIRTGTIQRGTPMRLMRQADNIALPAEDLERAKRLSRRKKVDYQKYILTLVHRALDREEAAQKRAARRKTA
jgi:hypothetical protein